MDRGLVLMDEEGNSHFRRKENFQKLLYADGGQFKMCYKLRQIHLDVAGGERQRVCYSAQVLSNSVAKALLFLFGDKYAALSNAISTINKWFDTMNSIIPFSKVPERCGFGLQMDCQLKALEDMRILISTMGFCNRKNDSKKKLPFQKGILISIQSTLELLEEMRNSLEIKYLLTKIV